MKVVLLNSGGKDTLASAVLLTREGHKLDSLYCDLGLPNTDRSSAAAAELAAKYAATHQTIKVVGPALVGQKGRAGHLSFGVFHQTTIIVGLGAAYATSIGDEGLACGIRKMDPLRTHLAGSLNVNPFNAPLPLLCPVMELSDAAIFELVKSDPLWRKTVTCNAEPACGTCGRCKLRATWLTAD